MTAREEARATLPPQRVLALADLTPAARNALWRAALVAREHGAPLHVLHVARDARGVAEAQAVLEQQCAAMRERLGVQAQVEVLRGDLQREVTRAARSAGLLVLASRPGNTLRERISGAPLERVIRLCRIPVLVVKRPAAPPRDASRGGEALPARYGRVMVSVDLVREAAGVIAAASWFSQDPAMEVFHAVSARRESAAAAGEGTLPGRDTAVDRARAGLRALIADAGAQPAGAAASIGFGRPATAVLARQRAVGAELLVVGKRQRGLFADYFLGGITQQILAGSRSDVLVVPTRLPRAPAPGPAAEAAANDGAGLPGGATT